MACGLSLSGATTSRGMITIKGIELLGLPVPQKTGHLDRTHEGSAYSAFHFPASQRYHGTDDRSDIGDSTKLELRMNTHERTRREFVTGIAMAITVGSAWSEVLAQAPPPPPRPRRIPIHETSFLPTTSDVMYRLRSEVTMDREEALDLERIVSANLLRQRALLKSFGIDPDSELPPNFRLTRRDASDLNDALDDLMDAVEDDAEKVLSSRATSAFRNIVRSASKSRETAIDSLRR